MNYFEAEIKPLLKGVQTFNDNSTVWVQYDIKALNNKQVSKLVNYIKAHYKEMYPRIQRYGELFIGDIQFN